jgi:hypothetical protein
VINVGRNHYQCGWGGWPCHPVLVDLPAVPTKSLFDEMDEIADELRENPEHVLGDDEIAFRQLQKFRCPDLSKQQFRDLFVEWRDRYLARLLIERDELRARSAKLRAEQAALIARMNAPPDGS